MEKSCPLKANIEVTFLNVAEIAAEAKRRKLLEEEAKHFEERTNDELAAAVALIMMRYQPISEMHNYLAANVTPKDKHITLKLASHFPIGPKKSMDNIAKYNAIGQKIKKHEENYNRITELSVIKKHKIQQSTQKSSLLTSCRNILKEFLSQSSIP